MPPRLIADTQLSTRAKRGLAIDGLYTIEDVEAVIAEHGERCIRERMFNIGPVTAAAILQMLDGSRS
jgi:hypothetical protein